MESEQVLIIDLGCQYTELIGRILTEVGIRSAIESSENATEWIEKNTPKAIILSGGSGSVFDENCKFPSEHILHLGIPILGICLGMQWITKVLGGTVTSASMLSKEYGPISLRIEESKLFSGIQTPTEVYGNHGDSIQAPPPGFQIVAREVNYHTIEAITNEEKNIFAVQFHPEVHHTIEGKRMFSNFLEIAHCVVDWKAENIIENIRKDTLESLSIPNSTLPGKAILGLSGGVDSSVVAALLSPTLQENLLCIIIDTGYLREGELQEIIYNVEHYLKVPYKIIEAGHRFEEQLRLTIDPEEKRKKIFSPIYRDILQEQAALFGASFIIQGSIAPDFIESGKSGNSALIKSHHNIDINWDVQFVEVHPLRKLFKYEVREIGKRLGLPIGITERQPFPGPGLAIRIVGIPATLEAAEIVRFCDAQTCRILKAHGVYDEISQVVVALLGLKTIGIKGSGRSYGYAIGLRLPVTQDFMTCSVYDLPQEIEQEIMIAVTKHQEITRLWVDVTTKPPGTVEFE